MKIRKNPAAERSFVLCRWLSRWRKGSPYIDSMVYPYPIQRHAKQHSHKCVGTAVWSRGAWFCFGGRVPTRRKKPGHYAEQYRPAAWSAGVVEARKVTRTCSTRVSIDSVGLNSVAGVVSREFPPTISVQKNHPFRDDGARCKFHDNHERYC